MVGIIYMMNPGVKGLKGPRVQEYKIFSPVRTAVVSQQ